LEQTKTFFFFKKEKRNKAIGVVVLGDNGQKKRQKKRERERERESWHNQTSERRCGEKYGW